MKVLVTGASGFIGRQLVPALLGAGHTVRVLVRSQAKAGVLPVVSESNAVTQMDVMIGTLPDTLLSERVCADVDAVIHTAGVAHVASGAELLRRVNYDAVLELAHAAKKRGVRRFIFLSSSKARYPRHSAYARMKAEAETALRALHAPGIFEIVCVRPPLVYGSGMQGNLRSLLRMLMRPWLPVFPGSAQSMGMISVQDLCRALTTIIETEVPSTGIWELSDGRHYTLDSIAREVRGTLGLAPPVVELPRPLFWLAASISGRLAPRFGGGLSLGTYRALYAEEYRHDPALRRQAGFIPQDSFSACLPELLEDLRH